jgi:hypothetical protein
MFDLIPSFTGFGFETIFEFDNEKPQVATIFVNIIYFCLKFKNHINILLIIQYTN